MRKIIVSIFSSMDGVIQGPGHTHEDTTGGFEWSGWSTNHWDEVMDEAMGKIVADPYDLLLGRRTYEIFAAHWPYQSGDMAKTFNQVEKFVVATTDIDLSWERTTLIDRDVVAELQKLKQTDGPDLLVYGSGGLIQTLLEYNLIDLFHIWTFPLTLGSGRKLFKDGTQPLEWTLTDYAVSKTGVLLATYTPAGSVRTGSISDEAASDKELARREKMEKGEF